jgi:beta-N-acetylhexosaminidase
MVFAPVADVTIGSRDTAIGSRSAGSDPAQVADLVAASTRGFADAGMVPVVKHFPGHGSVAVDSHLGLPRQRHSLEWLQRRDFQPFERAIAAQAPAVMVGHIAVSDVDRAVPGDLSPAVVDLLRTRLGFGGVVVSDSLQMKAVTDRYGPDRAVVAALLAGVDVVLMPADPRKARRAIIRAVRQGQLTRYRLEQAVARLGAVMLHQATRSTVPTPSLGAHGVLANAVSAAAVTVVSGQCRGPYVGRWIRPIGRADLVRAFTQAARSAGLRVGRRGVRLVLIDRDGRVAPGAIAVSVDTPYRMIRSSRSPTQLALFGSTESSWRVLVEVLKGDRRAPGRLPVGGQGRRSHCS